MEVWRLVFSNLSTSDLVPVCRLNRAANRIAQESLYSDIELKWTPLGLPVQIVLLIQKLAERPDLASGVRSLTLTGSRPCRPLQGGVISIPEDHYQDLIDVIMPFGAGYSTDWITSLSHGRLDAFVALLLAQLPNIVSLELTYQFARDIDFLCRLFCYRYTHETLKDAPVLFSRLTHVKFQPYLGNHSPFSSGNMYEASCFFYLPAVQHLETEMLGPHQFSWPLLELPDPIHLRSLKLIINRRGFTRRILERTTNLQSLDWVLPINIDESHVAVVLQYLDLQTVGLDLHPVADSLTSLSLDIGGYNGLSYYFSTIYQTIALKELDLRPLSQLRTIEAPSAFLIGLSPDELLTPLHERLPPSLEHLTLKDTFGNTNCIEWQSKDEFSVLENWWTSLELYTPRFISFRLQLDWAKGKWLLEERMALEELGAAHGIKVAVQKIYEDVV